MRLSILFWIYKDLDLCIERARMLRRVNPGARIYALFGGEAAAAAVFSDGLRDLCDDFYAYPEPRTAFWKWKHGDQLIAQWYMDRGQYLEWDSIFVAQWDLLMLEGLDRLCGGLGPNDLLLPGLRPLREVQDRWYWMRPDEPQGAEYLRFKEVVSGLYGFPEDPLACQFVLAAFPRSFLERYARFEHPELGFLEYKIPILAQLWGYGFFRSRQFSTVWLDLRPDIKLARNRLDRLRYVFHADKMPVSPKVVRLHAMMPFGRRVFHPFIDRYPG